MSTEFPDSIYVPTGTAFGKDFIQYQGYCYKKVSSNVVVSDQTIRSDIFGDYENCVDCNTCACPKTINFIVGGFQYSGTNITYREQTIPIATSSTGWQEIAIESGYLNDNNPNINFKPVQVRCYDRKIDIQSGIYISFDDRNAEIAHFNYVTGQDLYEREDLFYHASTGGYGDLPYWGYKNQYDKIGVANKVNTIKFKSLCETQCDTQDITFRIRGEISESLSYLNLGASYDNITSSWVYATCTGIPNTPGQIIECIPSGSGINFTDYFTQGYTGYAGNVADQQVARNNELYVVQFAPTSIELVNKDLLDGNAGTLNAKHYSITGNKHFTDYAFDALSFSYNNTTFNAVDPNNYFYYARDGLLSDFNFAETIGKPYGIDYNKAPNCMQEAVTSGDFNTFYRHLGGNRRAEQGFANNPPDIGDIYSGCYQASEFADGIFKNGTYVPMYFTGTLTGNSTEYISFINDEELSPPNRWETGVFVYQWYKSGDRSNANENITGFFGFLTGKYKNPHLHNYYKKLLDNHAPVNLGTPLKVWDVRSGNYPLFDANKIDTTFILNFNNNLAYQYAFKTSPNGVRHSGDLSKIYQTETGVTVTTTTVGTYTYTTTTISTTEHNAYDNYNFQALGGKSMMEYLNEPLYPTNTFVRPVDIDELFPVTDSGNPLHNPLASPIQYTKEINVDAIELRELKSIKFQLSWKNE